MSELIALLWLPLVIMAALTVLSGLLSGSETAFFYLSPEEVRAMRAGTTSERAVVTLLSQPERLLTAVLFWNLLINMTYFSVSVVAAGRLASEGRGAAAGVFGLASLALIIALGEVAPKSVAVVFRRQIAILAVWPMALVVRLSEPITPHLAGLTVVLRRTFWPELEAEALLDADDLERAVEASSASQEVVHKERQVLHNVLDLSEIRLKEAMRPRGSYRVMTPPISRSSLLGAMPPGELIAVREPGSDEINRVILLNRLSSLPEENLESQAVNLIHLPWCATLADALQQVRDRSAAVIDVVNEHGDTIGLFTRDDLLDTLLIPEEDRAKRLLRRDPILEVRPGVFHVEGITTLRHLSARLAIEDYEPEEEENSTVSGLLAEELGHLPVVGELVVWHGFEFKVIDVSGRIARRVLVKRLEEELTQGKERE